MLPLTKGHYAARIAETLQDLDRAHSLRHRCFITHRGLADSATDADAFDYLSQHILVEDTRSDTLVCCFRLTHFASGATITDSYSAQFYDLTRLCAYPGAMAELGRFCIHPKHHDPDILRLAWGALTQIVEAASVQLLFGCTSFLGADPTHYQNAFALLKNTYLGPTDWLPIPKSPNIYPFAKALHEYQPDLKAALTTMPPLLRTYLAMGGWVSDHAVIDTALNTLHVFTGLEIAAIPPYRARLLRALAT